MKKNHCTALEAGRLAQELKVANLILYHTEDSNLTDRKQLYRVDLSFPEMCMFPTIWKVSYYN
ncbi:hypothetical protein [Parabacteroides sp. PF5-9]|uniref:hypothetical protein n=1 Tax=Parabacteroides sp. PF5-9 TaxID=1742404 RepID=UPI00247CB606|nr:ribonuclease BN (tRNA processing enzyme) [Parabacteroides sp. PF5-9]